MSERKIIQQYLDSDQKLVTEFSDGSLEYTVPEQDKKYPSKIFNTSMRTAEGRLSGYSGPQGSGGYQAQRNLPKNINRMIDENEQLKAQLEQMRKNEASIKYAESLDGGGKLRLPSERQSRQFNSAGDMVNSLYDRMESGDQEAGRQISELWRLSKPGILALERQGFSMSECIQCHNPIIEGVDGKKCQNCGFNYAGEEQKGFVLFS